MIQEALIPFFTSWIFCVFRDAGRQRVAKRLQDLRPTTSLWSTKVPQNHVAKDTKQKEEKKKN